MRTVFSHFHNEEFLLPWWLRHHREIFDHGVLINHGSTDLSVEIIRDMVPGWKIVNSQLSNFNSVLTDFEVMVQESYLTGFKMALTTTEFVVSTHPFSQVDSFINGGNLQACCAKGVIMVDDDPQATLTYDAPLFVQKCHGYIESADRQYFNRIYHRSEIGQYLPGRHQSWLADSKVQLNGLFVLKYHYSPWVKSFIDRKLQIKKRLPVVDFGNVKGVSHNRELDEMERDYAAELKISGDLKANPELARALELSSY